MYGFKDLKKNIEKQNDEIVCPVLGCERRVKKMKRGDLNSLKSYLEGGDYKKYFSQFSCDNHKIYITPKTFIYHELKDNLLGYEEDKELLKNILEFKRFKSQLHYERSEDAVTFNIFRYLERNDLLSQLLEDYCNRDIENLEVIYWSYSQTQNDEWNPLKKAKKYFGERQKRGSEPDMIVKSDGAIFLIEAKLKASSKSRKNYRNVKNYKKGRRFLSVPIKKIINFGYRQLLRFWLIGARISEKQGLEFYLVNLVRRNEERNIEEKFGQYVNQNERRNFSRITWKHIYDYISNTNKVDNNQKEKILEYFRDKTLGYKNENLQKAFSI